MKVSRNVYQDRLYTVSSWIAQGFEGIVLRNKIKEAFSVKDSQAEKDKRRAYDLLTFLSGGISNATDRLILCQQLKYITGKCIETGSFSTAVKSILAQNTIIHEKVASAPDTMPQVSIIIGETAPAFPPTAIDKTVMNSGKLQIAYTPDPNCKQEIVQTPEELALNIYRPKTPEILHIQRHRDFDNENDSLPVCANTNIRI